MSTDALTNWEHTGVVPPRRLGTLLSTVRSDRGMTLNEVAERAEGAFSLATLASVERGSVTVSDAELATIAQLYGVATSQLVPSRSKLVVDLSDGVLAVPDVERVALSKEADRQEVMARYLAMVYKMRNLEPGTEVTLRVDDLSVLGAALHLRPSQAAADLHALMSDPGEVVSSRFLSLGQRLLIPAAGVLVAVLSVGSLVLFDATANPAPAGAQEAPKTTVEVAPSIVPISAAPASPDAKVGPASVQERLSDGTPGPIQNR